MRARKDQSSYRSRPLPNLPAKVELDWIQENGMLLNDTQIENVVNKLKGQKDGVYSKESLQDLDIDIPFRIAKQGDRLFVLSRGIKAKWRRQAEDKEFGYALGAGSSGKAILANEITPGATHHWYALKVVDMGKTKYREAHLKEELEINKLVGQADKDNAILRKEKNPSKIYLLMNLASGEELHAYLRRYKLPLIYRFRIAIQLAEYMKNMAARGVLHRDLKTDNVIVSGVQDKIAVIDFGIAKRFTTITPELIDQDSFDKGTRDYTAPEVFTRGEHSVKTDLFSLGRIFQELFELPYRIVSYGKGGEIFYHYSARGGEYISDDPNLNKSGYRSMEVKGDPSLIRQHDFLKDTLHKFVTEMISYDPKDRPSLDGVIQFFQHNYELLAKERPIHVCAINIEDIKKKFGKPSDAADFIRDLKDRADQVLLIDNAKQTVGDDIEIIEWRRAFEREGIILANQILIDPTEADIRNYFEEREQVEKCDFIAVKLNFSPDTDVGKMSAVYDSTKVISKYLPELKSFVDSKPIKDEKEQTQFEEYYRAKSEGMLKKIGERVQYSDYFDYGAFKDDLEQLEPIQFLDEFIKLRKAQDELVKKVKIFYQKINFLYQELAESKDNVSSKLRDFLEKGFIDKFNKLVAVLMSKDCLGEFALYMGVELSIAKDMENEFNKLESIFNNKLKEVVGADKNSQLLFSDKENELIKIVRKLIPMSDSKDEADHGYHAYRQSLVHEFEKPEKLAEIDLNESIKIKSSVVDEGKNEPQKPASTL